MPAPQPDVLNAIRAGTAVRHVFFTLAHESGMVRAWDGLGEFIFEGHLYLGVGGLMEIAGVSDSVALQNHMLQVTLNAVPFQALQEVTPDIRNGESELFLVWLDEADNSVLASLTMFRGLGDNLISQISETAVQVSARIRGHAADWADSPGAYYTDSDQQRLFDGDDGFKFVKSLENKTVTGWSDSAEVTAGRVQQHLPKFGFNTRRYWSNTVGGVIVGDNTLGLVPIASGHGVEVHLVGGTTKYVEDVTTAVSVWDSIDNRLEVGGNEAYIDVAGDVRSAGAEYIRLGGVSGATNRLREQGTIAGDGTGTGDTVYTPDITPSDDDNTYFQRDDSPALPSGDKARLVYDHALGNSVILDSTAMKPGQIDGGAYYVEQTTGDDVTVDGTSQRMKTAAGDCEVSDTGVVLTADALRVVLSGGSADNFLRVWT